MWYPQNRIRSRYRNNLFLARVGVEPGKANSIKNVNFWTDYRKEITFTFQEFAVSLWASGNEARVRFFDIPESKTAFDDPSPDWSIQSVKSLCYLLSRGEVNATPACASYKERWGILRRGEAGYVFNSRATVISLGSADSQVLYKYRKIDDISLLWRIGKSTEELNAYNIKNGGLCLFIHIEGYWMYLDDCIHPLQYEYSKELYINKFD